MPAGSEPAPPTLPRTWRPLGTTIAGVVASVTVLGAMVAAWLLLDAEIRAGFGFFQRITMVAMLAGAGAVLWGILRCRITASVEGVVVVNGYRTYSYEWAQVVAIRMPNGAPWATLDLSDGTARPVMGVQASDGSRAFRAVREVRALIDRDA
ncbi:PH domain-containing protein [Nocardioides zeae]|uniref:PH domain-containing protein n=1 Tax=Nocardioides imazamoxiresistens TaxID=3231893 RepID=A0ABU3PZI0_9ACTN|nr:PH domain-containing protein [Nocardioides zeae]MDT9594665.1 PH domain-containing protein [Nocardioides zeae]